jgi:hypothetical protein
MSYQYHGTRDLIALPGREVQTFPSGLARIDRQYICRRGREELFRQTLQEGLTLPQDNALPCVDGAYIFPAPVETIRDDGFVEFSVSAYGRTRTTPIFSSELRERRSGDIIYQQQTLKFSLVDFRQPLVSQISLPDDAFDIVDATNTSTNEVATSVTLADSDPNFKTFQIIFPSQTVSITVSARGLEEGATSVSSTNYGFFTEYQFSIQ